MTLDDILLQAKELGIYERRSLSDEYCELVFFSRDLDAWFGILTSSLGEPRKPPGREPTKEDLGITSQTGGIWINQTLFEKELGEKTIIAKIWPWDDERYMTLKMAVLFN
jgi:hypothetical protein